MKEYRNGVWTPSEPKEGDRVRIFDMHGGSVEQTYIIERVPNSIVITSHNNRAILEVGDELSVTIEIQDPEGNVVPYNDSFAMPVGRQGGTNYRTLLMKFVDGVCNKTTTWNDSGEFVITESMINMYLDDDSKFNFKGFNISVAE